LRLEPSTHRPRPEPKEASINRWFALALLVTLLPAQAADEWERTLATTASLRTGDARLVASDALGLGDGDSALVTYWEILRDAGHLDVYRCVDVVGQGFSPQRPRSTCVVGFRR
jgi:hypothetical protein